MGIHQVKYILIDSNNKIILKGIFPPASVTFQLVLALAFVLLKGGSKTKACVQQFIGDVIPGNRNEGEMKQIEGKPVKDAELETTQLQGLILRDLWNLTKCASELSLKGDQQVVYAQMPSSPVACQRREGKVQPSSPA